MTYDSLKWRCLEAGGGGGGWRAVGSPAGRWLSSGPRDG